MNQEQPIRDQAEKLRKRIANKTREIDEYSVADRLPPRSETHKDKKKRTRIRVKYPVIRLLFLLFVLLPLIALSIYFYLQPEEPAEQLDKRTDYETVDVNENSMESLKGLVSPPNGSF